MRRRPSVGGWAVVATHDVQQAQGAAPSGANGAAGDVGGSPPALAPSPTRGRRILVRVIVWGATLLAVVAIFAVWANRQLLNPDNWSSTSTQLLQNATIRETTSDYLVEQLYANVNVENELKSRLPTALQPLAGPAAGGLHQLAVEAAKLALASPHVQEVWRQANRLAAQQLVTIVNGGKGAVLIKEGAVTLNLATVVDELAKRLGLPNVSSRLPASAAHLTILKSNQIKLVQNGGKALKGLALVLTIIVPLLYALGIFLAAGYRRRTLMTVGLAIVLAGILVYVGRNLLINQVTDSLVKTESVKPSAHAVMSIATSRLSEIAAAFIIVGVPLMAAAWFAGPARLAIRARRMIAPFLREHPDWTYAIVIGIMTLVFIWEPIPATGKLAGILVFLALAILGTHLLLRQTAQEFPPDVAPGPPAPA
jgi:predicted outer membrane protein